MERAFGVSAKTVQRPIRGTVVDFRSADQDAAPGADQAAPGAAALDDQADTARACHGTHLRCVRLQGLLPAAFDVVLSTNILDAYRRIIEDSTLRAITVRTTATEADGRNRSGPGAERVGAWTASNQHGAARMNVPASTVLWILMKTPKDRLRALPPPCLCGLRGLLGH